MWRKVVLVLSVAGLFLSLGVWAMSYLNITYSATNTQTVLSYGRINWHVHKWYKNRQTRWEVQGLLTNRPFHTTWRPHVDWTNKMIRFVVPMWIPTLAFGSLLCGCLSLPVFRRRRRRKRGLCVNCGYDLRGSSERCPECNTPFQVSVTRGVPV